LLSFIIAMITSIRLLIILILHSAIWEPLPTYKYLIQKQCISSIKMATNNSTLLTKRKYPLFLVSMKALALLIFSLMTGYLFKWRKLACLSIFIWGFTVLSFETTDKIATRAKAHLISYYSNLLSFI